MEWQILEVLSPDERQELLALTRRRRFARNEVIFHEGDPGDTLHLVAKGHIAVRVTTPLGDVATVRVLKAGDFFGELAIISPGPRNATTVALDSVETRAVHRDQFEALRARDPAIDRVIIEALVTEVRRLAVQLVDALYIPVEKRIWRRVVDLAGIFAGSGDGAAVSIPLTQEELAQVVGATRPTINRTLKEGEDAGVVRLARGRVEVLDRDALARLAR
jgi:CRP/FNR family transcriptional regulator, cyclic AMP receptor protein